MLDTRRARPVVTTVFAAFDSTATTPPKQVTAAFDRYKTVRQAFADRPRVTDEQLAVAAIAAIEDGRSPETDPAVQQLLITQNLTGRGGVTEHVDAHLIAGLRDAIGNGDTIIATWRKPFT